MFLHTTFEYLGDYNYYICNKLWHLVNADLYVKCNFIGFKDFFLKITKSKKPKVEVVKRLENGNFEFLGSYWIENGKVKYYQSSSQSIPEKIHLFLSEILPLIWQYVEKWSKGNPYINLEILFLIAMSRFDYGETKDVINENAVFIDNKSLREDEKYFPEEVEEIKTFYELCEFVIKETLHLK